MGTPDGVHEDDLLGNVGIKHMHDTEATNDEREGDEDLH